LIGFFVGLAFSFPLGVFLAWRIIVLRTRNLTVEAISYSLEKARDTYDSGLPDEPREGAGPPLEQSSLFPARPGALALSNLAETNLAKSLDPLAIYGSLEGSGSLGPNDNEDE
jgi:hypothetical protein